MVNFDEINQLAGEALALLLRSSPGYFARLSARTALALTDSTRADLNILVLGSEQDPVAVLRECMGIVQERGSSLLGFFGPDPSPALLVEAERFGMNLMGEFPVLIRDGAERCVETSGFTFSRVSDATLLEVAGRVQATSFNVPAEAWLRAYNEGLFSAPGVAVFTACEDSKPISTVHAVQAGATVGIWSMATLPSHQKLGAGRFLLSRVMNYFMDRGVTRFYLSSSRAGAKLYASLGYRQIYNWTVALKGSSSSFEPA